MAGQANWEISPNEEAWIITECEDFRNALTVVKGTLYRIDITVTPDLQNGNDALEFQYIFRTNFTQNLVITDPIVFAPPVVVDPNVPVVDPVVDPNIGATVFPFANKDDAFAALAAQVI